MNLVEMTSSTLKRRRGRRSWRPNLQLSLLDTPMALPRRRQADDPPKAASKLASMELNCGGLVPHDRVMSALHLLCEEVMPRFH